MILRGEGFQREPSIGPPWCRETLSESCTPDRCCFSSSLDQRIILSRKVAGKLAQATLRKLYFHFLSHCMGYDCGDSYPFDSEPICYKINALFGSKSKGKLKVSLKACFLKSDSFPFDFEPNRSLFGSKSNGKLSPRSYPIQFERKWNTSFISWKLYAPLSIMGPQLRASFWTPRYHTVVICEGFEGPYLGTHDCRDAKAFARLYANSSFSDFLKNALELSYSVYMIQL